MSDYDDIRQIIREVLNGEQEVEEDKINAEKVLASHEPLTEFASKAQNLLTTISSSSLQWNNLYSAIEDLRSNFRSAGALDTSANPRQVGMASVLLILFELVIQTNLLIQPIDIKIIINTIADNFENESQIKALERFIETLNL